MKRLRVETNAAVAVVHLCAGEQNRFDLPLLEDLLGVLESIEKDDEQLALVFTGTHPKYFSTGMNIAWMQEQKKPQRVQVVQLMHQLLYETLLFPKPIVGALNGHTFGYGAIWACAFDFRFMNENRGYFCFPEVEVPFQVPDTLMGALELAMPLSHLQRAVLSAERMTGVRAKEVGLVHDLSPSEEVLPAAVAFARQLTLKNRENYALCKQRIRAPFAAAIAEGRDSKFAFGE